MPSSSRFGSNTNNLSPYSDSLSLRLPLFELTLLLILTRWLIMQKVRSQAFYFIALLQLVGTGFQILFHSPLGVLFTFPLRYYALSVTC